MWDIAVNVFYLSVVYYIWKFILYIYTRDYVTYYIKFIFYIICTLIVCVILLPYLLLRPRNLTNGYLMARILRHVSAVIGVTWEHRNEKVLVEERAAVIVANHQSYVDILGMFTLCDVAPKVAPVCKKELLYFFPIGLAAYLIGCIFIDRKNPIAAHRTLKAEADVLFKNKAKMMIFPEGTRNKASDKLLPFKKGAFILAIAFQVPIMPVVASPYYFLNTKRRIFNKGHAVIQCLEPIPTEGLTMDDLPELTDRVQKMMSDTYEELKKEVTTTKALH